MSLTVTQANRATWLENLTGEMLLFGLLGRLLFSPLEKEFLQSLLDNDVFSEVPFGADHPDVIAGTSLLAGWSQSSLPVLTETGFNDLLVDMTSLFSGLGKVKAPPWESVHFGKHRLVFQERTRQVREWYRRYGLVVENPFREPDDHIGLELSFLAHLAKLGVESLDESESTEHFGQLLEAQKAFLQEHLLAWVFSWEAQVQQHAQTSFYQGLALLTAGAVRYLASLLEIPVPEEAGK